MNYHYINRLNQAHYAFKKETIEEALAKGKIPCIDLSSEKAYLQIIKAFPNNVLLLKVVSYLDEDSLKETFENQGRDSK